MTEFVILLAVVYAGVGAVGTWQCGKLDGSDEFGPAEMGPAASILLGIFWPLALLYFTAFNRANAKRAPTDGGGASDG